MKAHLLNSVLQLGTSERQVLQGTNDGPVEGGIRGWRSVSSGELDLRIHVSSRGLAVKHAGAVKVLMSRLPLVEEEAIGTTYYPDAEEVVEWPQVLDGKLGAKALSESSKEIGGEHCQDDVVDVEKQIGGSNTLVVYKQRRIRASGPKHNLMKKCRDVLVIGMRCLLELIQGA